MYAEEERNWANELSQQRDFSPDVFVSSHVSPPPPPHRCLQRSRLLAASRLRGRFISYLLNFIKHPGRQRLYFPFSRLRAADGESRECRGKWRTLEDEYGRGMPLVLFHPFPEFISPPFSPASRIALWCLAPPAPPLRRVPFLGSRVIVQPGPVLHLKALAAPLSRPEMGSTCPGGPCPAGSRFRRVSLPLVSAPELGTRPQGAVAAASSPMKNFRPDPLIETRDFLLVLACR